MFDAGLDIFVVNLNWHGHDVDYALAIATLFSMLIYRIIKDWCRERSERTPEGMTLLVKFMYYGALVTIFFTCVYSILGVSSKIFIHFGS